MKERKLFKLHEMMKARDLYLKWLREGYNPRIFRVGKKWIIVEREIQKGHGDKDE